MNRKDAKVAKIFHTIMMNFAARRVEKGLLGVWSEAGGWVRWWKTEDRGQNHPTGGSAGLKPWTTCPFFVSTP